MFPRPALALRGGLLAVGGDLEPDRLLLAYRMGIFPWYSEEDPILWWSPNPRLVLIPEELHVSRRLERVLRRGVFSVTADKAFERVIEKCASVPRPGQDGTWITRDMIAAYCRLHEMGYAHSFECWQGGELAGGLYGVSLGSAFFGESMFSLAANASKAALAALVRHAKFWNFSFIDCQIPTPNLLRLGAKEIRRAQFLGMLDAALKAPTRVGPWTGQLETY